MIFCSEGVVVDEGDFVEPLAGKPQEAPTHWMQLLAIKIGQGLGQMFKKDRYLDVPDNELPLARES
jgi:hypothetical protein